MKNALLFFVVSCWILIQLPAQISLDRSDMPQAGDVYVYSVGDTLLGIDLTRTGPNQTWDFSSLNPISQSVDSFLGRADLPLILRFSIDNRINTIRFINTPDSIPGAGVSLTGGYDMYAINGDAYESMGQATVVAGFVPVILDKVPGDTVFSLPMRYQNTGGGSSFADVDLSIPTLGDVYYEQSRDRQYEIDGWGQLITPFGQFQVLRTRTEIQGTDSTRIALSGQQPQAFRVPFPLQVTYEWWGKGRRGPLLRISAARLGQQEIVTRVEYRDSLRNLNPTSIDRELTRKSLSISPNPVRDMVRVQWDMQGKPGYLEVFSMEGKQVYSQLLREADTRFSVAHIPAGTYLTRIVELGGSRVFLGKLLKE